MPIRLLLLRLLLAPILFYQGKRVRKFTLILPEAAGARSGVVSPPHCAATTASQASVHTPLPPLRLLVLGDSSAAGVGVETQPQALAQPCAQHLAQLTNRSVAWQLLAQSGLDTPHALNKLQGQWQAQIAAADVVLVVLGVNDVTAQRSPAAFAQHYAALLQAVAQATGAQVLLANALPPMQHMQALPWPLRPYLGLCARALDAALQKLCSQGQGAHYLPAPATFAACSTAADGFHPGADAYRVWAQAAACSMAQALHYHPSPC